MGCGHSKINIYPRKSRSKTSHKKSVVIQEKNESEEEDGIENDAENTENLEDCDQKKPIKVKPYGGALLAQSEISSSQQNFFKMLDEKIENGPDYNSESETEKAAEQARLNALLKDWETASAGSRSLPATPKRRSKPMPPTAPCAGLRSDGIRSVDVQREMARSSPDRTYVAQIPPNVIHQSYGVTQVAYRQLNYNNPNYISQSPSHLSYPSALQYQAISPMYSSQPTYQPPPPRPYPSYNQHGSPIKTYTSPSPKHIPFDHHHQQPPLTLPQNIYNSPNHKYYGPAIASSKPIYSNGELLQQPMYNHQYQQYKETREQIILQHHPQQAPPIMPQSYRTTATTPGRSYQSSVTIPIVKNPAVLSATSEINALHRKQYELT